MGSGKSTVGQSLALLMKSQYLDLDRNIEIRENLSITEIFDRYGEPHFRSLEFEMFRETCSLEQHVVALGGGALCSDAAWDLVPSDACVVWLNASENTLLQRLQGDSSRPLLQENRKMDLKSILEQRVKWYSKAHVHISTDGKHPEEISSEILEPSTI